MRCCFLPIQSTIKRAQNVGLNHYSKSAGIFPTFVLGFTLLDILLCLDFIFGFTLSDILLCLDFYLWIMAAVASGSGARPPPGGGDGGKNTPADKISFKKTQTRSETKKDIAHVPDKHTNSFCRVYKSEVSELLLYFPLKCTFYVFVFWYVHVCHVKFQKQNIAESWHTVRLHLQSGRTGQNQDPNYDLELTSEYSTKSAIRPSDLFHLFPGEIHNIEYKYGGDPPYLLIQLSRTYDSIIVEIDVPRRVTRVEIQMGYTRAS